MLSEGQSVRVTVTPLSSSRSLVLLRPSTFLFLPFLLDEPVALYLLFAQYTQVKEKVRKLRGKKGRL
jgi:hypothetical protein